MAKTSTTVLVTLLVLTAIAGAAVGGIAIANNYGVSINLPWEDNSSSSSGGSNSTNVSNNSENTSTSNIVDTSTEDETQIETSTRSSGIILNLKEQGSNENGYAFSVYSYSISSSTVTSDKIKVTASWSGTDDISKILTVSVNTDAKTIEIVAKGDFSSAITLTLMSTEDNTLTGIITVECVQRFKGFIEKDSESNFYYVVRNEEISQKLPWNLTEDTGSFECQGDPEARAGNLADSTIKAIDYTDGFSDTYTIYCNGDAYFSYARPSKMKLTIMSKMNASTSSTAAINGIMKSEDFLEYETPLSGLFSINELSWAQAAKNYINDAINSLDSSTRLKIDTYSNSIVYIGFQGDFPVTVNVTKNGEDWKQKTYTEKLSIYFPIEELDLVIDPTAITPEINSIEF